MQAELIGRDPCSLARRWILDRKLSEMLVDLDRWAAEQFKDSRYGWPGLSIISGHRSHAAQAEINPDAPGSLHTRCPSMAADLRVGTINAALPSVAIWQWLGVHWKGMGGRWGGFFGVKDENHFDLGIEHPPTPPVEGWPLPPSYLSR